MPLQPSVKGNSTSTHTPPNILRLPGFYVIFVFEEVESFMAGASWTEIVRAIERSTVPPVFDHDAFGLFDKLGDNTSQTHDSPQNMLFRGFFAIKSTETILDLKIRVLHEIRNSSKARRWWRRHMGTTIPLYAKPTPLKASFGDSDINKYHSQKYLKGKHWTEANQSKQSLQSIDISTNNLQSLKKIISHMAIADAGKINPNQQFENFSVKMNEIEDMIPRPEEPDLSDLESTSYISSDYDEEINNLSKNRENEEINSNNIQKRGYKKKKKDIDHNYYQDHTEPQRRTVRIQPEDFVCYACRIKPPEGELQGTNIRSASIQQLKPTPKPISPYCKKQSVVGTELFPAFSPYAATYELPPPPEIDPQFNMTQNNNNQIIQNHQHSFPPLRSLASESYTQFRSKQKPNEFSLNVEIGDKYNTLINDPILCKDNEKSISALKNLYKNEKDQPKDINCIDKQMNKKNKKKKKQQESFPNDNRIPLLIFCVPGKIHVFDLHKKQNIETESNKSNKNEDDIDLKGEMCIVMTQGRKLMNQLIIPKEMPFVNVLRLLSIGAYTSHETYLNDNLDIKYLNANQFIAGRVISNNADGKRQLIINRHFFDYGIQKREKDSQLDPVYQPQLNEYEYEQNDNKQDEQINQEKRIKRRNQMKIKFEDKNNNQYYEDIQPYTSVWEVWGNESKKSVGGRVLRVNRGINYLKPIPSHIMQDSSSSSQITQQQITQQDQDTDQDEMLSLSTLDFSLSSLKAPLMNNNVNDNNKSKQNYIDKQINIEHKLSSLESERLNRLKRIAEWEASNGALLQTSIHMSVAHASEYNELLKSSKDKIQQQIQKLELRIKELIKQRSNEKQTGFDDDEDLFQENSQVLFHNAFHKYIDDKQYPLNRNELQLTEVSLTSLKSNTSSDSLNSSSSLQSSSSSSSSLPTSLLSTSSSTQLVITSKTQNQSNQHIQSHFLVPDTPKSLTYNFSVLLSHTHFLSQYLPQNTQSFSKYQLYSTNDLQLRGKKSLNCGNDNQIINDDLAEIDEILYWLDIEFGIKRQISDEKDNDQKVEQQQLIVSPELTSLIQEENSLYEQKHKSKEIVDISQSIITDLVKSNSQENMQTQIQQQHENVHQIQQIQPQSQINNSPSDIFLQQNIDLSKSNTQPQLFLQQNQDLINQYFPHSQSADLQIQQIPLIIQPINQQHQQQQTKVHSSLSKSSQQQHELIDAITYQQNNSQLQESESTEFLDQNSQELNESFHSARIAFSSSSSKQKQNKQIQIITQIPQIPVEQKPLVDQLNFEQKKKLREIYLMRKVFKLIIRIEKKNIIHSSNKEDINSNNQKSNDLLLDIYQLFFPDELYFLWQSNINESGIGKQYIQDNWRKRRELYYNEVKKWAQIQLGVIRQRNVNQYNPIKRLLSEPQQIDQYLNNILKFIESCLSRALTRILKFDLTTQDIEINTNRNNEENLNQQVQQCGNDNDDEEDGVVFDCIDALASWERRNNNNIDDEEQSIIQQIKENMNRPRFHPLNPSFRSKQRVFRVIEEMEEELDTTFVTLNLIWKCSPPPDIEQKKKEIPNFLLKYIDNNDEKQQSKQPESNKQEILQPQIQIEDDDYPTIYGGGGMWSKRWGKFPKLNKNKSSNLNIEKNQKQKINEDEQKNLRFFIGKCIPELLEMRTLMKGLWESGTRRIQTNQKQTDNSILINNNSNPNPFPRVLHPYTQHHAPIVPCNHKCGIIGTVHVWKRLFIVHSHRGHTRHFSTKAKLLTRKELDDTLETNINSIELCKNQQQQEQDEQIRQNNNRRLRYNIMLLILQYLSGFGDGTQMLIDLQITPEEVESMENQLNNLLSQQSQQREYLMNQNIVHAIIKSMNAKYLFKLFNEMRIELNGLNKQTNKYLQNSSDSNNNKNQSLHTEFNQYNSVISLQQVNLDQMPEIHIEQQIQSNQQEKWFKFLQNNFEYPQPICILKGPAWDNYHRKGREFYQCSEIAATFGQNNQMFDPRYPVFVLQRFPSLTNICLNEAVRQLGKPKQIMLPQIPSDYENKFKQIIEKRQQLNKNRQFGKENEIESEGILSYDELVRFKNEIRLLISKDSGEFLNIFSQEDLMRFVDISAKYYEQVEKKCQHINIDIHYGIKSDQIINNNNENKEENQLNDNHELLNKQGLLVVGDIHGNFNALLKVLDVVDDVLLLNNQSRGKVVFLGDYIDRGKQSIECIILIIAYKLAFPDRVFLLRGNHESLGTIFFCTFFNLRIRTIFDQKLRNKYSVYRDDDELIAAKVIMNECSQKFINMFTTMPISCTATLLYHSEYATNERYQDIFNSQNQRIRENQTQILDQTNQQQYIPPHPIVHSRRIQLNHAGITPIMPIASVEDECPPMEAEDEYALEEKYDNPEADDIWTRNRAILKFTTWGDPEIRENITKGRPPFNIETTDRYSRANGIDEVIRGHQSANNGLYFPMHNGKIATIFSSDTYCQWNTKGAVYLIRLSTNERLNQNSFINQLSNLNSLTSKTSQNLSSQTNSNFTSSLSFAPILTFDTIQLESDRYVKKLNYSSEAVERFSKETEEKRVNSALKRIKANQQTLNYLQLIENEVLSCFDMNQVVINPISQIQINISEITDQQMSDLVYSIQDRLICDDDINLKLDQAEKIKINSVDGKRLVLYNIRQKIKEQFELKTKQKPKDGKQNDQNK